MKSKPIPQQEADHPELTDAELVAGCIGKDPHCWERLIHRYQRLIYSIPMKARLSTEDAADVFQTVCLKLLENLPALRQAEKLSSWLITTTTRETWRVSAAGRRSNRVMTEGGDSEIESLSSIVDNRPIPDAERIALEQEQLVREGIVSLSERCQELITLLFYKKEESSYVEIARRMNMPVSSIGPTRARCLEKLKKALEGKL